MLKCESIHWSDGPGTVTFMLLLIVLITDVLAQGFLQWTLDTFDVIMIRAKTIILQGLDRNLSHPSSIIKRRRSRESALQPTLARCDLASSPSPHTTVPHLSMPFVTLKAVIHVQLNTHPLLSSDKSVNHHGETCGAFLDKGRHHKSINSTSSLPRWQREPDLWLCSETRLRLQIVASFLECQKMADKSQVYIVMSRHSLASIADL